MAASDERARVDVRVALPLVLALATAVSVVLSIGPWPVGVFQDDGIYAILARSLAEGEGYRYLNLPGAPWATHYPPGYPVLLAILWRIAPPFPESVVVFKLANAGLLGIATVGTWVLTGRAGLGTAARALTTLLFTTCAPLVLLGVMVLSEPLFLAMLFPALLLAERVVDRGTWRDALAAGAMAGAVGLVRTLGACLVPGLVLVLLVRRRWSAAAGALVGAALVLAPWHIWTATHAGGVPVVLAGKYGSYGAWFGDAARAEGASWMIEVVLANARQLVSETWAHTSTALLSPVARVAATLGVAILLVTGARIGMRRLPVTTVFTFGYLVVVLAWPFAPARFLWGIWPVIGVLLGLGAHAIGGAASRSIRVPASVLVVALVVGYTRFNLQALQAGWWSQVQANVAQRARPLAEWVRANTRPGDVLATDDDALMYLYTGRRTVPISAFTAQEHLTPQSAAVATQRLREILAAYKVDHVIATTAYGKTAARALASAPAPALVAVAAVQGGDVYVTAPAR
ncbi:MAG: glycosyltransferase family 39 protein [Gemmatimonadaceae bacterium]|nr:glycosyltransferase family 39 protein [Gemmatimonadaceae bacterium]